VDPKKLRGHDCTWSLTLIAFKLHPRFVQSIPAKAHGISIPGHTSMVLKQIIYLSLSSQFTASETILETLRAYAGFAPFPSISSLVAILRDIWGLSCTGDVTNWERLKKSKRKFHF
jgi:hypothetical protein